MAEFSTDPFSLTTARLSDLTRPEVKSYMDQGESRGAAQKLAKADRLEDKGKLFRAEEQRLKAEYGTSDPDKIAKAMAAQQFREYQQDPFKASGYGDRARESMQRAMQGVRQTAQAGLRSELNRMQMAGGVAPGDAIQAFGEADERAAEVEAQQLGGLAAQVREQVAAEGQRRLAALTGAQVATPIKDQVEMQMVTQVLPGIIQDISEGLV
jgi:hypothetical protein